jgi:hypothetical protein
MMPLYLLLVGYLLITLLSFLLIVAIQRVNWNNSVHFFSTNTF